MRGAGAGRGAGMPGRSGVGERREAAPRPLPEGTLTMLFTDIEGSTTILDRLGPRYAEVVSTQRRLLREAFARWRGHEMGTEGDSFFVVFETVGDAVGAAVLAQRELGAVQWPDGVAVRVRMGMHTGEPQRHEDGYVGMDVHLAARVAATAHGGQVVLTAATHRIAEHLRPDTDEVSFLDLGSHRLKDLPQRERLYQLAAGGLDRGFPPLKSLGSGSSLPRPTTSLVGREDEVAGLAGLVADPAVGLVTLAGPGGVGKSRLAIAVAQAADGRYPDGVYFVPLAAAQSADVMWSTIAETVGATGENKAPPTFLEYLAPRAALLVLDNLEQLADAGTVVHALLGAGPGVDVLATSRRPLHLAGEHEHPVAPLAVPDPGASVACAAASGAVELFLQRARLVRPELSLTEDNVEDIVVLCHRLDGLPLAIELVASRVKLLGPRALRARLDQSLAISGANVGQPDRQHTLRSTIAWSHQLLLPDLARVFRQLAVFDGEFDLGAVAAVADLRTDALEDVADLVDLSLLVLREGPDGEPRIRMLRTITAYGREVLEAEGEADTVQRRHARHYAEVVEELTAHLRSGTHVRARDRIEAEHDNVRAALAWSLGVEPAGRRPDADDLELGLGMCKRLGWFWYACGYQAEGRRSLGAAVDAAQQQHQRSPGLTHAVHMLAVLVLGHGEPARAREMFARCLAYWRQLGDRDGVGRELNSLALAHRDLGELETARELFAEGIALAREDRAEDRLTNALSNLALLEVDCGNHDEALALLQETLELDTARNDAWGLSVDRVNLTAVLLRAGRTDEAGQLLVTHAPAVVAVGDAELTVEMLEGFGVYFAQRGEPGPAARMLGATEAMRDKLETPVPGALAAYLASELDRVRDRPSAGQWARAVGSGRTLSAEAALTEALEHAAAPRRPSTVATRPIPP